MVKAPFESVLVTTAVVLPEATETSIEEGRVELSVLVVMIPL